MAHTRRPTPLAALLLLLSHLLGATALTFPAGPTPRIPPACRRQIRVGRCDLGRRRRPGDVSLQVSSPSKGGGNSGKSVSVGIAGAGAVAMATAALLHRNGHRPALWSPSGRGTADLAGPSLLNATGAITARIRPDISSTAADLCAGSDVILLALPANGHAAVMDALAPHLDAERHTVIVSSHASLGALYLCGRLEEEEKKKRRRAEEEFQAPRPQLPIVAWGTTVVTARRSSGTEVRVCTVRSEIDLCTVPASATDHGVGVCRRLFGGEGEGGTTGAGGVTFRPRDGLLAISLSNLNAQNHLGIVLANMSRIERGEAWSQGGNITPNVGRLLEALDAERLNIASGCGLTVRTVREHFALSFHVPEGPVSDMNAAMVKKGNDVNGPSTVNTRYVTEDVPYGLVLICILGSMVGRPALLHDSGVRIVSAMYGEEFGRKNGLLEALGWLDGWTVEDVAEAGRTGRLPKGKTMGASTCDIENRPRVSASQGSIRF